jgi:predicted secreted protein
MAIFALTNVKVTIGGVDLSDHCTSAQIKVGAAVLDTTAFSSGGWEAKLAGLKNWSLDCEFNDDFATGSVNKTSWDALIAGTAIAITFKPVNTTTAATNPEFQGNVVAAYEIGAGGKVGDVATSSISFTGTGALTRAVS